jgi:hypothetical protein
LLGGFVPLAVYVVAHGESGAFAGHERAWALVTGGLIYSAKTVFEWARLAFTSAFKSVGWLRGLARRRHGNQHDSLARSRRARILDRDQRRRDGVHAGRAAMSTDKPTQPHNLNSKDNLISLLNGARATFVYGYFIESLARKNANPAVEAAKGGQFQFTGRGNVTTAISLAPLGAQLESHEREIRGNYFLFLEHQTLRVFYELVHSYCQRSGQTDVYAAEPFMQFARVWRNVVAHGDGAVLTSWPSSLKKKKISEVSWRNRKLTESQAGTELSLDIVDLINLQGDIYKFCQEKLK